jgi:hypothetical protein
MPIINKVSAAVFDAPAKPKGRQMSPEMLAMIERIRSIRTEKDVYEVLLTGDEKPTTVRQQLTRASKAAGVEIAVRRSPHGFYIGLMTPERQRGSRGRGAAAG